MTPIQNLALIFGAFLLLIYIIWRNLRIWAYVGFDASRAGEENYFLCDGIADDVQVQAAIDYVSSKRSILPRIIKLGKGAFKITNTLYLKNRMWLVGIPKENSEL